MIGLRQERKIIENHDLIDYVTSRGVPLTDRVLVAGKISSY